MPIPVSLISNRSTAWLELAPSTRFTRSTTSPCSVNLTALPTRLREDLAEAAGVAAQGARDVVVDEAGELEVLGLGRLRERAEHVAHGAPEVEVHDLEVHPSRLHLREVEDVVDDLEQAVAGGVDDLRVLALLRREVGVEEQPRHADHAVHRRADLVAHVGHELRLEARRLEGGLARPRRARRCSGPPPRPRPPSPSPPARGGRSTACRCACRRRARSSPRGRSRARPRARGPARARTCRGDRGISW